jgi:hypothetical protein
VKRVRVNKLLYILTWIIYKAQHSDTALVLDGSGTRKPFQSNALLADQGKYFQNLNFFNFLATVLTVFTAKYTSNHASAGGTLILLMQASHCFDLLTRYKLKYQNIR